jgi:glycosyltransferase involved in cell wall biosynthesis
MLEPHALTRSRHRKRLAWMAFQKRILSQARCLHVTCETENRNLAQFSLGVATAVVPLSSAIQTTESSGELFLHKFPELADKRIVLYLGRIHPIKGLERFAAAWASVASRFPDWQWVLAGPDEGGYRRVLERSIAQLGVNDRTTFVGPVSGALKSAALAASEVVVLPSEVESFGMSVLEALAAGRPVLASRGSPWSGLATHRCGDWVENTIDDWSVALQTTLTCDVADLQASGRRGQDWVRRDFNPQTVAGRFEQIYKWTQGDGDQPEFVQAG